MITRRDSSALLALTLSLPLAACDDAERFEDSRITVDRSAESGMCVWAALDVGGKTVAVPSVLAYVPPTLATIDPVQVHVDPTTQQIAGYELNTPGLDYSFPGQSFLIPAVEQDIDVGDITLPIFSALVGSCVYASQTIPGVETVVPDTVLETPGAFFDVPAICVNPLGLGVTCTDGRRLEIEGETYYLPGLPIAVPPQHLETPPGEITISLSALDQDGFDVKGKVLLHE